MDSSYDVCVVGAGVMGSSTARHLAKIGKKTLLLEQFPLPHWRGSSHGQTRVFRCVDPEPHIVKMANDALKMWRDIQNQAGETILIENVGMLEVEEPPGTNLKTEEHYLRRENIDYQFLSSKDLKDQFPGLVYGPGYCAIYEKSAGILMADKCLKHLQKQFVESGGTLYDRSEVIKIQPDASGVTVLTNRSSYRCKKIIVTAGPWVNKVLKPLGIQLDVKPVQAPFLYWKVKQPGAYDFTKFPIFYDVSTSDGRYVYGLPSFEYPGLIKLGPAGKAQQEAAYSTPIDPDMRDSTMTITEGSIAAAKDYIKQHLPFVDGTKPAIVELCMYTLSFDRNFILDKHPEYNNVIIAAGFSGQGFKHGPVVGKILSDLALDRLSAYDLSPFRISKYLQQKSSL
ncbi:peroxisomal sarcosine oxidase [Exaiptasia diaphana]|uniref:FAD dependent oxidoreductase domain-containing protein n=1 Tax=Exaiptasia diaphana TaxID=2652724 RepID=A0A913YV94_EXADI|nr:peroxisomal sarcosine oxidase [Exaiptasia diaphana]XP_028518983.1 peroxisomal sarcosine oxidase [Exaiptasia diaphana]KXJ28960.1 Peroxisomal sarcosine oxidase [Exaiptasia diaphana]